MIHPFSPLASEVKRGDSFKIELYSEKSGSGTPESQLEFKEIIPDLCPLILSDIALHGAWHLTSPNKSV